MAPSKEEEEGTEDGLINDRNGVPKNGKDRLCIGPYVLGKWNYVLNESMEKCRTVENIMRPSNLVDGRLESKVKLQRSPQFWMDER